MIFSCQLLIIRFLKNLFCLHLSLYNMCITFTPMLIVLSYYSSVIIMPLMPELIKHDGFISLFFFHPLHILHSARHARHKCLSFFYWDIEMAEFDWKYVIKPRILNTFEYMYIDSRGFLCRSARVGMYFQSVKTYSNLLFSWAISECGICYNSIHVGIIYSPKPYGTD